MPAGTNAARGILAIAQAVLAQQPDIPLDELARKLATTLGASKADVRDILQESGLFATENAEVQYGPPIVLEPLPAYVTVYEKVPGRPSLLAPVVYDTTGDNPRTVMMGHAGWFTEPLCDGLNLGLELEQAVRRSFLIRGLTGRRMPIGDGLPEYLGPERYVCDLLDQSRAWGPFPSAEDADAFRETDPVLRVWAITTRRPYSTCYPPTAYAPTSEEVSP